MPRSPDDRFHILAHGRVPDHCHRPRSPRVIANLPSRRVKNRSLVNLSPWPEASRHLARAGFPWNRALKGRHPAVALEEFAVPLAGPESDVPAGYKPSRHSRSASTDEPQPLAATITY
jgi:hypothetical protein